MTVHRPFEIALALVFAVCTSVSATASAATSYYPLHTGDTTMSTGVLPGILKCFCWGMAETTTSTLPVTHTPLAEMATTTLLGAPGAVMTTCGALAEMIV